MLFSVLCLGIAVHLLLLYSIFDIYYSSPIVHGARHFQIVSTNNDNNSLRQQQQREAITPADRLVFFSADGLRSSAFYGCPECSPFLHGLIRGGKTVWGVSQSHVPTESRPGHVALLAGFYEDVSAVTRGWKHNPVPFDSTLNQSKRAFLWGSPDIVYLFSANLLHVYAEVYAQELEDFASAEASQLDQWVFQRVEVVFENSKNDAQLAAKLSTKRTIFFLHLLGLDTNGHGHKPRSVQYLSNIRVVDRGVQRIVQLFEEYFKDNRTAYMFTADHGMTDWGSHGDGTDDEVQTPFIAWGAGIQSSFTPRQPDLAQIDLAPLQSALLGIPIPVNSFGIIPIDVIKASARYRYQVAYANYKQMAEQFQIRRAERRAHSFRWLFAECPTLRFEALTKIEGELLRLTQLKRYEAAWKACIKWIPLIREALNYYHRYHRFSQGIAICALCCAWNFVLYAALFGKYQHLSFYHLYAPSAPFQLNTFLAALFVWIQGLAYSNYLYFLSPIFLLSTGVNMLTSGDINKQKFLCEFLLQKAMMNLNLNALMGTDATGNIGAQKMRIRMQIFVDLAILFGRLMILIVFPLCLLVAVFFYRRILSVIIIVLVFCLPTKHNKYKWDAHCTWKLFCLTISMVIFPWLDTVGKTPTPWLVISSEAICCIILCLYQKSLNQKYGEIHSGFLIIYYTHWLTLGMLVLDIYMGPNFLIRLLAWLSIPMAFALPFWTFRYHHHETASINRILFWNASLLLPYVLMSLGHEHLFLCLFSVFLFAYFQSEHDKNRNEGHIKYNRENSIPNGKPQQLTDGFSQTEWFTAVFLVACIEIAFFGTGNIASLNSFNPSFLQHFLTVFSPFTMASLLLLKVFIPFLIVAIHFVAIAQQGQQHKEREQLNRLSTLVALITNTMAMVFFYCLKTDGSWLEIGISISNYVICLVCSAATYLLMNLANWLIFGVGNRYNKNPKKYEIKVLKCYTHDL